MYCPKCTLEIKGEDQTTCPICDSALVASPVESPDSLSDEELKLKELIADIDGKVTDSNDKTSPEDALAFEIEDQNSTESDLNLEIENDPAKLPDEAPDFNLELDSMATGPANISEPEDASIPEFSLKLEDKPLNPESTPDIRSDSGQEIISESNPEQETEPEEDLSMSLDTEPLIPGGDASVDLEQELTQDNEDKLKTSESPETDSFDLEKELGLDDETENEAPPPAETASTLNFDDLPISDETSDEASVDHTLETVSEPCDDSPDPKQLLDQTLEELDPIADIDGLQKKSLKGPLLTAFLVIILIIAGAVYFMNKQSEAPPVIKPLIVKKKTVVKPKKSKITKGDEQVKKEPVAVKKEPPKQSVAPVKPAKEAEKTAVSPVVPPAKKSAPVVVKEKTEPAVRNSITYSIHAGSFRKKEMAQTEIERFGKNGFNGYIERVNLGKKGVWYRVKIGLYASRLEAKKAEIAFLKKIKVETRVVKNK